MYYTMFNQLINDFLPITNSFTVSDSILKSNPYYFKKKDDKYHLELPIPGLTKSDLIIREIKGSIEIKNINESSNWVNAFTQRFVLPEDVDNKKIEASINNGVLRITVGIISDYDNTISIK